MIRTSGHRSGNENIVALTNKIGIAVKVELFGTSRLAAGRREVDLLLPSEVGRQEFAEALAEACPALVGKVIRNDLSDLQEGYVLNLNGLAFLRGGVLHVQDGDSLLILPNQAGG